MGGTKMGTRPHTRLLRLSSILQGSNSTYFFSSKMRFTTGFRTACR